jgi:hypothetical protein
VTYQWYAVDRMEDVTGISGPGIIAWALQLDNGFLMFWDTVLAEKPTETVEYFDTKEKFDVIHGHEGATVLRPVADADAGRGRTLLRRSIGNLMYTLSDLAEVMADVYMAA